MSDTQIVSTLFDDGDGVLVDLNTKRYYQLNETAMIVWDGLEKGRSITEIVDRFTTGFDVSHDQAMKSVEKIIQKFHSLNLRQRPSS